MNLSIIPEEDLPLVNRVVERTQPETDRQCQCNCNCNTNEEAIRTIEKRILNDLTTRYNRTLRDFFNAGAFTKQLQTLVGQTLEDMALNESSALNTTMLDPKHEETTAEESKFEMRLNAVESTLAQATPDANKVDKVLIDNNLKEVKTLYSVLAKQVQELTDYNKAKELAEKETPASHAQIAVVKQDIAAIQKEQEAINMRADNQNQYGRLYILEFLHFGYNVHPSKENCAQKILYFLHDVLGIRLRLEDIDIAHRMSIPQDRIKQGKNYLPPIYVKFVHKSIVQLILRKRYLLDGIKNQYGQNYAIQQNLTLPRRQMWAKVMDKLTSYRFIWIHNGKIFVRKDRSSRAIMISGDHKLQELINKQNEHLTPSVQPPKLRIHSSGSVPRLADKSPTLPATPLFGPPPQPPPRLPPPLPSRTLFPFNAPPAQYPPLQIHTNIANSHIANDLGYSFTPYERHQLKLGSRNSPLSPQSQKQYLSNGKSQKSCSYSR